LSKRVLKVLEDAAKRYRDLLDQNLRKNQLQIDTYSLVQEYADKLKSTDKTSLKNSLLAIQNELLDIVELPEKEDDEEDPVLRKKIFLTQKQILEEAIRIRTEASKKLTHPIERNYAEAPIFSATVPNNSTMIMLRNSDGHLIEQRMGYRKVRFTSKQGTYLSSYDERTFFGLQKMWELKGGKMEFSFHLGELADVVGDSKEGGIYELLETSLIKLATTTLIMEDYSIKSSRIRSTDIHNLIQSARVDHESKMVNVTFNKYLHEGLEAGNVVRINLMLYQDFNNQTTRLLYPLLSSLLRDQNEFELETIIQTLGITEVRRGKVIERIRKALTDLVDVEIIERFELRKVGREYKTVYIEPSEILLESFKHEGIMVPKLETEAN